MKWKNILKVSIQSILKARMRSLLTALGIIIGVSSVIVMVAVGEGAQSNIEDRISSLGSNLLVIFPGFSKAGGVNRGAGSFNRFTLEDVENIKKEATLIKGISPVVHTGGQIIGGGNNWSTSINGVSPDYIDIRAWEIEYGDCFTERDERVSAKVAILGSEVAENLFPDLNPVGEMIRIKNVPFKVIGVLKEKGQSAMGSSNDDIVLVPATTALHRLSGGRHINMIYASAWSIEDINQAEEELTILMRESHRIETGEEDDFTIRNQTEITEAASETSKTLTLLLGSVAGVSLIVGGIGIMNIMLVSVTERTREIGIRLSIGARENDILVQFLTESIVLSLSGGILGILLALGIVYCMNEYTSQTAIVNAGIMLVAFLFSGAVGIFFGFYPARKAAALNPIEALRYE